MKKLSILITAALFVLSMTAVAMAEVDVDVSINKDKNITVNETVNINKNISIRVSGDKESNGGAAESGSHVNASNIVTFNVSDGYDANQTKHDLIKDSVTSNAGITHVNQSAGNMNNQGNVVGIAFTPAEDSFAQSQAAVDQLNAINLVNITEEYGYVQKTDLITNSINDNRGIVGVNQSVGNANNQHNVVDLAIGTDVTVAMAEADLGQKNAANRVREVGTWKTDTISNSINGNRGIVNVNQAAGNMNNQANVMSIAVTQ